MVVRTGGKGAGGISLLMVPLLNTPGVTMRRIKVGGQRAAGTTFIELDDVKVPVENLVGRENQGMRYVMQNFNHEVSVPIPTKPSASVSHRTLPNPLFYSDSPYPYPSTVAPE